ncbi:Crossover junction endonuclease mus81 [Entophlyctis luteolus]|nr:Crossover junction endonuclease mus81 [Entophlyctis luteolus]
MADDSDTDPTNIRNGCLRVLRAMYEEERARGPASFSRMSSVYKRAHDELAKYPLPVSAPRELLVVKGIGPAIVKALESRLPRTAQTPPLPPPARPSQQQALPTRGDQVPQPDCSMGSTREPKSRKRKTQSEYVPKYRSGAWSILLTLRREGAYLTKAEIISKGHEFADQPLDAPGPGGVHTGWSSITTLISKELVMKYGHPPRFTLTEEGEYLADRMIATMTEMQPASTELVESDGSDSQMEGRPYARKRSTKSMASQQQNLSTIPHASLATTALAAAAEVNVTRAGSAPPYVDLQVAASSLSRSSGSTLSTASAPASSSSSLHLAAAPTSPAVLRAGAFDVVLVLDNREIKNGYNRSFFKDGLAARNVRFESRALEVGDVTPIVCTAGQCAQDRVEQQEIMLEYILERKTLDDLVASIKDGRFKEQKVPLLIYLIEEVSTASAELFGMNSIHTAITQTQVENGFFVKKTYSAEDTLNYLVAMSNFLARHYQSKTVQYDGSSAPLAAADVWATRRDVESSVVNSISFAEFSHRNAKTKNFSLGDVWIRQLLTVPGMSSEKACFFVKKYSTSARLCKRAVATWNGKGLSKVPVGKDGN